MAIRLFAFFSAGFSPSAVSPTRLALRLQLCLHTSHGPAGIARALVPSGSSIPAIFFHSLGQNMNSGELVELAALVATHSPSLIRNGGQLSNASTEQYWIASKTRLDEWARSLKLYTEYVRDLPANKRPAQQQHIQGVLEEVFLGEILTRVWTGVTCALDQYRGTDQTEPTARSVLVGHLEARHRALQLLLNPLAIDAQAAANLNRVRRRAERWTDLLVGYLAEACDVSDVAQDPQRARDFAEDLRHERESGTNQHAWPILLSSLRSAFQQTGPPSPNAKLNARIASSLLACFPADMLDSVGMIESLWQVRMNNMTVDTQGMIDELLAMDESMGYSTG